MVSARIYEGSMSKILFFFAFFSLNFGYAETSYEIRPEDTWLPSKFTIFQDQVPYIQAEKTTFLFKKAYALEKDSKVFTRGIFHFLSWGEFYAEYSEIDVYEYDNDKYKSYLGTIRGLEPFEYAARFEFLDHRNFPYAIAQIDLENSVAKIFSLDEFEIPIVEFEGTENDQGKLYWSYKSVNPTFNVPLIHIFAALLADRFPPR